MENSVADPFEVRAQSRAVPPEARDDTPVVSVAWRLMAGSAQELQRCRGRIVEQRRIAEAAWILLADEAFRLQQRRHGLGAILSECGHEDEAERLQIAAKRLQQTLEQHQVEIESPIGEPYTLELSEYIYNEAYRPREGIAEPLVGEMIEPVVRLRGEIIRPGKAVIEVPAESDAPETEQS